MTVQIADIASYQGNLTPAQLWASGVTVINLKISHGLGQKSVHPDAAGWVTAWRKLGGYISTFHYFTAEASGRDQANYALDRMLALGLFYDTMHQLDVESDPVPTLANVRQYLEAMSGYLLRPLILYTGDWWWTARSGWNVSDWTPYLWAAPNSGYLGTYPGDASTSWRANYGGWPQLTAMQYSDKKVIAGVKVSASAIKDPIAWVALRRGRTVMSTAPASIMAGRKVWQSKTSLTAVELGITGDAAHKEGGDSYHLGADQLKSTASYSKKESPRDNNPTNDASALDIGYWSTKIDGKTHDLRTFSAWLIAECKRGAPDTLDIREVICSVDGKTVIRWDRLGRRTGGDDSHLLHTHISWFRDSAGTSKAPLFERYWREIEEGDMPTAKEVAAEVLTMLKTGAGKVAVADAVWNTDDVIPAPAAALAKNPANTHYAGSTYLPQLWHRGDGANNKADQLVSLVTAMAKVVDAIAAGSTPAATEARQALATALAAIDQVDENVLEALGVGQTDTSVAGQLVALFGPRAQAIGREMLNQAQAN